MRTRLAFFLLAAPLFAAEKLTLDQAERMATQNHPQLASARYQEAAAAQVPVQVRSRNYPTVFGSTTGALAEDNNTRILAGGLNNPIIYNRLGAGITISQLVTDFGRTRHLADSAQLRAGAQTQSTQATRATILLDVDRAYFGAARAQAVLRVAEQTVAARKIVADQTATLAQSKLKSELDVTFARVNLEEARLLLSSAENEARSAMAELSTALGLAEAREFDLTEEPLPSDLPPDSTPWVQQSLQDRPDVKQIRLEAQAAGEFARAERALLFPVITGIATAGVAPVRIDRLQNHWDAAGINMDIPILNGGLFSARHKEALARQQAAEQNVRDLENRVARDLRLAFLSAVNAFQRLQLTASLRVQAEQSLKLAQARYDLGLGSIVELSQAQLNVTRAQIEQASAKFDYQSQRAVLDYQRGIVR